MTRKQEREIARFDHTLNVTQGFGRVIYGEAGTKHDGTVLPAGWVLPGGRRTQNRQLAESVAAEINAITARQMGRAA